MIDEELLEEYINRFNRRYGNPGDGYIISDEILSIDEESLDGEKKKIISQLISYGKSNDIDNMKQHFGVYVTYGLSLAAMELKGKYECITHQDGFRDEAIIRKNLDEFLNLKTDKDNPNASISNIVEWCVNPESNLEISDNIWKSLIFQPIKTIYRTHLPGKALEIVVMLPPVSKELDFPDWKSMLSTLRMKNVDISITDYGHVFSVNEQERKYIIMHQTDGIREFLILSAYERVRGKVSCIGSLAFDVWDNDKEYELQNVTEIKFTVSWNLEKYQKDDAVEVVSDCHLVESKYQAGSGFNSFLGNHSVSFLREMYKLAGTLPADAEDISSIFSSGEALQAIEVGAKLLNEKNLYNISLEDMVAVSNRLEQMKAMKRTGVMTGHKAKLGTYKGIAKNIDISNIKNIPANYANITWKLKDKKLKTIPYEKLEIGKYSERQIIESIVRYYEPASTEVIAEDYLYLVNRSVDVDPSAFFAAKLFLLLITIDSLTIDSRHEVIKTISNVDDEQYTPIETPEIPKQQKKVTPSVTQKKYSIFIERNKSNVMSMTIEEMGLSVRSYNCLKRAGIRTVGDITKKSYQDIMKVRNLGRNSLNEILTKLNKLGVQLSQ